MNVGYLGPQGTFTEEAAFILAKGDNLVPYSTFYDCLKAVVDGEIDEAVVPIENSIEGVVNATVDELVFNMNLYIHSLLALPITQNLIAKEGTELKDVTKIVSHPHAIPQCKDFLNSRMPNVPRETMSSTGMAVEYVASSEGEFAAIGNRRAADIYGLKVLAAAIQDNDNNYTQFARVSRKKSDDYDNADVVTVAFSTDDRPGALFKVLEIFSVLDVNLSKIYSRPMKNRPNEYVFVVDMQVKDNVEDIKSALKLLERKTDMLKLIGAYKLVSYTASE
jgi:prephenate dehydratase